MQTLPFPVRFELPGWNLLWAELRGLAGGEKQLARLRLETAQRIRDERELSMLAKDPVVAELRRLFRQAGTDPTRYRPSSEALLRRILKGYEIPEIHAFVDLSNCLSARLAVPCCVMEAGTFEPPFLVRAGLEGESYDSLRGPFSLEGRPLLVDAQGPCDTPITGNQRVKVRPDTQHCWLVAYLPAKLIAPESCGEVLSELLAQAPVADIGLFKST